MRGINTYLYQLLVLGALLLLALPASTQTKEDILEMRRQRSLSQEIKPNNKSNKSPLSGLSVDPNKTAVQLVEELLGDGFEYGDNVTNAVLIGHAQANGFFDGSGSNIGMSNGIIFASGYANSAEGPNTNEGVSGNMGTPGDTDLNNIPGVNGTGDASGLEFDFVPESDTIKFQYVFGSDEYCFYVDQFNDAFAFFLTGDNPNGGSYTNENIALIPGTTTAVTIDNLNHGSIGDNIDPNVCDYCEFYIDNKNAGFGGQTTVEYDGFTTVLTAWAVVIPCTNYHIKIVIADDVDRSLDSGVFLEANSFTAASVEVIPEYTNTNLPESAVEGCNNVTLNFNIDARGDDTTIDFEILEGAGQATYNVDYTTIPAINGFPNGSFIIPAGQTTQTLEVITIDDGIAEGTELFQLLYTHDLGCDGSSTDTVKVEITDHLAVDITPFGTVSILCGDSTSLWVDVADGYPDYTYTWSNGAGNIDSIRVWPIANTDYTIGVSDQCGYNNSYTFSVEVQGPVAEITGEQTICAGDTVVLYASGGVSYLWNDNSTLDSLIVTPEVNSDYSVMVTTDLGCQASTTVSVPVNPLPNVSISPFPNVCVDNEAFVLTQGSPSGGTYFGEGVNHNADDFIFNATGLNPGDQVDIIYAYSDANNCENRDTLAISVVGLPEVTFHPNDNRFCIDEGLIDLSAGSPAGGYYYGPGVSSLDVQFDPDSTTTGIGQHIISYSFTDANTCTNTKDTIVEVLALPDISFSNIPGVCVDNGVFLLEQGNHHPEGVYSGPGVNSTTGEFDPIVAGGIG
ncbi:MAG: hypothetical protein GQ527_10835, partial [Bacteroidales bacterium]|nr:hypothetical protein [Bacteroidales bacterium]